jgi:hypothetical protein
MNILDRPYFMENKEWYYWDEKEWKYKLTDKAPKKAIDSYNEFYKNLREHK